MPRVFRFHFKDSNSPIIPEDEEYDEDERDGLGFVVGPAQCLGIDSSQLDLDLHVRVEEFDGLPCEDNVANLQFPTTAQGTHTLQLLLMLSEEMYLKLKMTMC